MSAEEWCAIPGYDGWYEASTRGRIRSNVPWRGHSGPRVMTQFALPPSGYIGVYLNRTTGRKRQWVHRMILLAFVGPCPEDQEVRHLDGDKTNNRLENLRYGTRLENAADMVAHGTHAQARKTTCVRGHEFNPENTRYVELTNGRTRRHCRPCEREGYARRAGGLQPVVPDEVALDAIRRVRGGETQRSVADDLGVSQSLVSLWARGQVRPWLTAGAA